MESPSALAAGETPSSGDMVEPKTEPKDVAPIFADTSIEISVDEGRLVEAANTSLDSVDLTSESDDAIEARMIDDSLEIIPPPSSSPVKRKHGVNDEPSVKKARTAQSSDAVTSPSPVFQDTESSFESLSSRSHSPTGERAESSRLSVHSNFSTPEKSRSISVSDRRTPSNKRQRFFLQCVEVPPMKPIIRRSWSSQGPSTNNNATIVENDVFLASENSPIRNGLAVRGGIQRVKAAASESRIPSTRVPLSLQKSLSVEGSTGRADPFKTPKGVLRRSLSQGSSSLDPPQRPVIDLVMESYGQSGESLEQSEQSDNAIPLGSDDSNAQFFATIMSSDLKARSPVAQGNEINSPTKAHVDRRRQFLRTESMPVTHSSSILSRPPATVRTQSLSSELQLHLQQAVSYKDATRAMEADGLVELSRMLSELSGEVNSALAELALRRSPKEGSSDALSN
ncbi:hypothetical protein FRC02_000717 [Tulasnella sp. 418]|nr:hypothetical protein FRC02_000717 [Tulasnella sp. 418]